MQRILSLFSARAWWDGLPLYTKLLVVHIGGVKR